MFHKCQTLRYSECLSLCPSTWIQNHQHCHGLSANLWATVPSTCKGWLHQFLEHTSSRTDPRTLDTTVIGFPRRSIEDAFSRFRRNDYHVVLDWFNFYYNKFGINNQYRKLPRHFPTISSLYLPLVFF